MRIRHACIGLLAVLAAGCASQPPDDSAERLTTALNRRIGLSEPELVRSMRRMPDANYQQDSSTRLLMWRLEKTVTVRGQSPEYVATNVGIVPVGGRPDTSHTLVCNVEWMIVDGTAKAYTTRGKGCP